MLSWNFCKGCSCRIGSIAVDTPSCRRRSSDWCSWSKSWRTSQSFRCNEFWTSCERRRNTGLYCRYEKGKHLFVLVCQSGTRVLYCFEGFFFAEKVAGFKQLKGGVQFVDSIPKSPSGKILRGKLRQFTSSDVKSKLWYLCMFFIYGTLLYNSDLLLQFDCTYFSWPKCKTLRSISELYSKVPEDAGNIWGS